MTAGTTEYAAPDDFQTAQRVALDDAILYEQTLQGLDRDQSAWIRQAGKPLYYYVRTATNTVIGFNPVATIDSTGTITLDYFSVVLLMANSEDTPFNNVIEFRPFHDTLAKFAAYRILITMGQSQLAEIYAKEYASDVKRMQEVWSVKPNYRPSAIADQGRR